MKTIYELTIEEMKLAVADFVKCRSEDVEIFIERQWIGYGPFEHQENVIRCRATKS